MNSRLFQLLAAYAMTTILSAEEVPVVDEASAPPVPAGDAAVVESTDGEPAVDAPSETEEENLPTGFPVTRYTAIWENSPFNREVIPAAAETLESSFARAIVLEGVINDDEKGPVAYVRDTRDDKSLVITTAKTESHPFTIVSAKQSNRPEETKITITDGKETGEIGFEAATLTQAIAQPIPSAPPPKAGGAGRQPPILPQVGQAAGEGGGAQPGGIRPGAGAIPQIGNPGAPAGNPPSVTPALDALDAEPRRRRVPLPGAAN